MNEIEFYEGYPQRSYTKSLQVNVEGRIFHRVDGIFCPYVFLTDRYDVEGFEY